jgi:hypothetical protein
VVARRRVRAQVWDTLVLAIAKPGAAAFRCVVIHAPRAPELWGMATNLPGAAYALWGLSRACWPIAQAPLTAQQMLGAHRACVFGGERRDRHPALALLAGNILAYVVACGTSCCRSSLLKSPGQQGHCGNRRQSRCLGPRGAGASASAGEPHTF